LVSLAPFRVEPDASGGHNGAVNLRGRVGIVSGADSPAGEALARALAAQKMSLVLIARPGHHVRDLAEELEAAHGIRCFPAALDVADREAVDRIVMHAEQHVGAVDLVVNLVPGCLTDALRPTMEQRGRGHLVDVEAIGAT
jgi:NAD(P)-dependent dehydrogenase (short-subunit alcohol dehydrogenase family)